LASPTTTSRTTAAVGRVKPCGPEVVLARRAAAGLAAAVGTPRAVGFGQVQLAAGETLAAGAFVAVAAMPGLAAAAGVRRGRRGGCGGRRGRRRHDLLLALARLVDARNDHAERAVVGAAAAGRRRGLGGRTGLVLAARLGGRGSSLGGSRRALVRRRRCGRGFGGGLLLAGGARRFLGFALLVEGALLRFLLAAAFGLGPGVLFLFALLLRLGQLARGLLALGLGAGFLGDHAALDVGALGAHFHVHRLGAARGAAAAGRGDLQLADLAALQGDLARRAVLDLGHGVALAVGAAQEAEQLHLLGAADDLLRIGEFHAGLAKLPKQLVHRHAQYLGELFDRDVRHRVLFSAVPALIVRAA
jgi:hypothetical protein